MNEKLKSDYIKYGVIALILFLLIEISFFNPGFLFSVAISIGCMYFGRKWSPKTSGKILFWFGLIGLIINILSTFAFKLLLFAVILYFVFKYANSKQQPTVVKPVIRETDDHENCKSGVFIENPLFRNVWVGRQRTPEQVYEWNDINIQAGIGDTIIDLSNTVLPKGESVIMIRNFVGNVQVFVPYDLEVYASHSAVAGSFSIFNQKEWKVLTTNVMYQTPEYGNATQKVKIVTSMFIGNLEVKRI